MDDGVATNVALERIAFDDGVCKVFGGSGIITGTVNEPHDCISWANDFVKE